MSIKLFSSDDRLLIYHIKNLLESSGISCSLKNDLMYTLAGEVPVFDVLPEIWIDDVTQLNHAQQLMHDALSNAPQQVEKDWICPDCGESHTGRFMQCWKCGYQREI